MEFLYPREDDDGKIILLLLVSKERNTYAMCYEWDASQTLQETSPRLVRRQLPAEYRLPSLIIPLIKASSFLLVSTTSMAVYDMLRPVKQASRYPIPAQECQDQRVPLWAQWARPNRELLYKQAHDDIYLCREDGKVFYVAIDNEAGDIEYRTYLGSLGFHVDSAFDVLDTNDEGGDLILAVGDMGDGGLFIQNARDCPRCVQRLLNWAPIVDSVVVEPADGMCDDRIFACSASASGPGALVEFRQGVEAQIGLVIAEDELSNTRDMWAIAEKVNGGIYILTSDPESSLLIYLPPDFGDEIGAISEAQSGLNYGTQTVAAGCTNTGAIIQVTDKAIHVGVVPDRKSLGQRMDVNPDENIINATVSRTGSLILTAIRRRNSCSEISLYLTMVQTFEELVKLSNIGVPVKVDYEPVCLSVEDFTPSLSFAFIGTSDGSIVVYHIKETQVTFISRYSVDIVGKDDASNAVESIARITSAEDSGRSTLLCGLRNGFLVPFSIDISNSTLGIYYFFLFF